MLDVQFKLYLLVVCLIGCSLCVGILPAQAISANADEAHTSLVSLGTEKSLVFTKNMGQWPDSILFRADAHGAVMWITKNGIWYQLLRSVETSNVSAIVFGPTMDAFGAFPDRHNHERHSVEQTMIKAEFVGASEFVTVIGQEEMTYKCNYFIGNDPSKWRSDVPNYRSIIMHGLYLGVDVTFSTKDGNLQEQVIASTKSELAQVVVAFRGAGEVVPQPGHIVTVQTSLGQLRFEGALLTSVPLSNPENRITAPTSTTSGVGLVYSTYLGGSDDDEGYGIAVDPAGNAYVTGYTRSVNFPTQNPNQDTSSSIGLVDIFVCKFDSSGNGLLYSTYLGGLSYDYGAGIAVDAGGNAYVTGYTGSLNFPVYNSFQNASGGDWDAFVTKLSGTGNSIVYSTYLGGSAVDYGEGIATDTGGNAYVTGETGSLDFPIQNPFQASRGGDGSEFDAFVAEINSAGSEILYSTYLGGSDWEYGKGIAVDAMGDACVTGWTKSTDFPTQSPFQAFLGGSNDAFVTKLSSGGSTAIFSTYLGGDAVEIGRGIAVDSEGDVYVTGQTGSVNFPVQNPYYDLFKGGFTDAFVSKFHASGSGLVYSTYLGGNSYDYGFGIAVDSDGRAYVAGASHSSNFPTLNPFQTFNNGTFYNAFVTKLTREGSGLIYSTYLGGDYDDGGKGIAVSAVGNAYITGWASSANFPTLSPYQPTHGGGYSDAFVCKLGAYCCIGSIGNLNDSESETPDVSDLSWLIGYLTQNPHPTLPCPEEGDINGSSGQAPDLQDLSLLIAYFTITPRITLPSCP